MASRERIERTRALAQKVIDRCCAEAASVGEPVEVAIDGWTPLEQAGIALATFVLSDAEPPEQCGECSARWIHAPSCSRAREPVPPVVAPVVDLLLAQRERAKR